MEEQNNPQPDKLAQLVELAKSITKEDVQDGKAVILIASDGKTTDIHIGATSEIEVLATLCTVLDNKDNALAKMLPAAMEFLALKAAKDKQQPQKQ